MYYSSKSSDDILTQIVNYLPLQDKIRYRCVSKRWKELLDPIIQRQDQIVLCDGTIAKEFRRNPETVNTCRKHPPSLQDMVVGRYEDSTRCEKLLKLMLNVKVLHIVFTESFFKSQYGAYSWEDMGQKSLPSFQNSAAIFMSKFCRMVIDVYSQSLVCFCATIPFHSFSLTKFMLPKLEHLIVSQLHVYRGMTSLPNIKVIKLIPATSSLTPSYYENCTIKGLENILASDCRHNLEELDFVSVDGLLESFKESLKLQKLSVRLQSTNDASVKATVDSFGSLLLNCPTLRQLSVIISFKTTPQFWKRILNELFNVTDKVISIEHIYFITKDHKIGFDSDFVERCFEIFKCSLLHSMTFTSLSSRIDLSPKEKEVLETKLGDDEVSDEDKILIITKDGKTRRTSVPAIQFAHVGRMFQC